MYRKSFPFKILVTLLLVRRHVYEYDLAHSNTAKFVNEFKYIYHKYGSKSFFSFRFSFLEEYEFLSNNEIETLLISIPLESNFPRLSPSLM